MKQMRFKLNYNHLDCLLCYIEKMFFGKVTDLDDLLLSVVLTTFYLKMRAKYAFRFEGNKNIGIPMDVAVCLLKKHYVEGYNDYEMGVIVPIVTEIDKNLKQFIKP